MRIWIDQDSVVYDLYDPWLSAHNKEYPMHQLLIEDVDTWDTSLLCARVNCESKIYSYFDRPELWTDGKPIQNSQEITRKWKEEGHQIGILTTTPNTLAASLKLDWLSHNFPHIPNIIIVNGHLKKIHTRRCIDR